MTEKTAGAARGADGGRWRAALHELGDDERETFVEGFRQAAAAVWPGYDPDADSGSLRPFCRPWDVEPVVLEGAGDMPDPGTLGALWFAHVRLEMAVSPWSAGVR